MPSLFRELGLLAESNGQRENQLSRTFAAAFNHSSPLRSALVPFVLRRFGLRSGTDPGEWRCRYEKRSRSGDGRLDLILSPRGYDHLIRRRQVIVLENKVGSRLTRGQLAKYRPQHSHIGVITARYPEVPAAWLRKERIAAFRWHEMHALLLNMPSRRRSWVVEEFIAYLEDMEMASRGLTRTDLRGIQATLNLVSGPVGKYKVHNLRFDRAAVAKAFVDDVANTVMDHLAADDVRLWGPGFYKQDYKDGAGVLHQFSFALRLRARRGSNPCIVYSLIFPQAENRMPYAWVGVFGADGYVLREHSWSGSKLFDGSGRLLEDQHAAGVARTCRRLVRYLKQ